ncbi:MAG TPA: ABC transporter ATP-binding protein [Acetobacteraceae bacterium]|nr:ABC transporter ATP-binding protein [Acetobacteraceae bacterium]
MADAPSLLEVEDLHVAVRAAGGLREVVRGVSFRLDRGKAIGLVGESGSGKTLTTSAIVRLLPAAARTTQGSVRFKGEELTALPRRRLSALRGKEISLVVQDSLASLNPIMRIGKQVREPLLLHRILDRRQGTARAVEMLGSLGLPDPRRLIRGYPHELSGGMRQRAMIATALIASPPLVIADEPTTALDATVQAQIMEILSRLNREMGVALILVSHDLGVVSEICDDIAVMYAGRIVETGPTRAILETPEHPYTRALLESMPTSTLERGHRLKAIPGEPPRIEALPPGCPFSARCGYVMDICRVTEPPLTRRDEGEVACWAAEGARNKTGAYRTIVPSAPAEAAARAGAAAEREGLEEILSVEAVTRHFRAPSVLPFVRPTHIHALDDVSITVRRGETLGIAGETGCGKSTLANCVLRLAEVDRGRIVFRGRDVTHAEGDELRRLRRHMQPIFQDPYGSLNPRQRVRSLVAEPMIAHGATASESERRVREVLQFVGLGAYVADQFPHELSGGQRQRIGIARAITINPDLIVADEPISALDVSVQAQVLNLFVDLQRQFALTLVFISHDLRIVRYLSSHVAIMFLGKIVEYGPSEEVCTNPLHPYTAALLSSVPGLRQAAGRRRIILRGDPPSPVSPPSGCRFRTRCAHAAAICAEVAPEPYGDPSGRIVACHFPGIASTTSAGEAKAARSRLSDPSAHQV